MRVAIAGVGRMGRRHIQVVKKLGLAIAGICDQNAESLLLAQKEQGVPQNLHYTDLETMLQQTTPDCVVVATTAPTHCAYTCMAAHAGARYVLCEKPMGTSLAECDLMIEVCRSCETSLAINHQMRFMEQYTEPKHIINSAEFGGLCSITVVAGNFGMAMGGTHYFEMFRYMTDEVPTEVRAWFAAEKVPNPRGAQFEDKAGSVRLLSTSGKRFYMEIGADMGHGITVVYSGRYGQLVVDELAGRVFSSVREEQYRGLPTTRYGMPSIYTDSMIAPADVIEPTRQVLEALLNGADFPGGNEGRMAVATLVGAYISDEESHRSVQLSSGLPRNRVFPWA